MSPGCYFFTGIQWCTVSDNCFYLFFRGMPDGGCGLYIIVEHEWCARVLCRSKYIRLNGHAWIQRVAWTWPWRYWVTHGYSWLMWWNVTTRETRVRPFPTPTPRDPFISFWHFSHRVWVYYTAQPQSNLTRRILLSPKLIYISCANENIFDWIYLYRLNQKLNLIRIKKEK